MESFEIEGSAVPGYNTTEELLERSPVPQAILRLGIPAMLGQFFNILYSIVDRIFAGRIPGAGGIALASIGVCAPALTAVSAFAYMVGIGGASLMSISLGEGNAKRARETIGNALALLLAISIAVTVALLALRRPLLHLLGCSEAMYPYARSYFTIYICGTAASLCGVGLNQFLLAQGFAKEGMAAVVLGAVANVILDPLLIFGLGMGVAGAAVATVLSQCLMALYVILRLRRPEVPVRLAFAKLQARLARRIVAVGSMSFLITLMDNLIVVLLNVVLRRYGGPGRGDELITCAAVVQSFMTIVFCPAQGITSGCGTLFGYNYGRRDYGKIRQAFLGVFLLCGAYMCLLELCVQLFPRLFVGLFLSDAALIGQASACVRMYTLMLPGVAVQYALVDDLTAMGKLRYALPLSMFRKLLYVACVLTLPRRRRFRTCSTRAASPMGPARRSACSCSASSSIPGCGGSWIARRRLDKSHAHPSQSGGYLL